MKERGILFSAAMIRALLAGTKTQTRRIVKDLPGNRGGPVGDHVHWFERGQQDSTRWCGMDGLGSVGWVKCPYGEPGDRLWVRETWRCFGGREYEYQREQDAIIYRATDFGQAGDGDGWRPSIFMPRWASRISLDVTSVRVERLHAITEVDARAEGVTFGEMQDAIINGEHGRACFFNARDAFAYLWAGINGAESWKANPFVWVVEFRRVEAQERAG
jgi:hypothetical protein